jgi:hypothetical protein
MVIASLTASFDDFRTDSGRDLIVTWPATDSTPFHLRAVSVRPYYYYQMDAMPPGHSESFHWPSELLASEQLTRSDIGVVGWTEYHDAHGQDHVVYVPVRITQNGATRAAGDRYELIVVPSVEATELYVSIAPVGRDGLLHSYLIRDHPLGYGFYPPEQPIRIPVRDLGASGLYAIEIGVRYAGGSTSLALWLEQPNGEGGAHRPR